MKTSHQFNYLAVLIALFSLVSCSSNTETQTPLSNVHNLKSGESFTYHEQDTDTSGIIIPGSDTTLTAIVTKTALPFAGKNNVAEIIKGSDTTYLAEPTDSSFTMLQNQVGITSGASIPAIWIPFSPSQSGKTIYDSTQNIVISGMSAKLHATIMIIYGGKSTSTVGSATLPIVKFTKVVTVMVTVFGQDYTTTVTVENDYAPTIGYFTRRDAKTISDSPQSPVPNGIHYSSLLSYQIR